MSKRPQIGLIVETTFASDRETLRGIARYLVEHDPGRCFWEKSKTAESQRLKLTIERSRNSHSSTSVIGVNAKLDRATRLLRETDLSIEQIARLDGYMDATYFSTFFRKEIGSSPRDHRKLHRKP